MVTACFALGTLFESHQCKRISYVECELITSAFIQSSGML